MRHNRPKAVAPLNSNPRWPEGYVAVLREAGAIEKAIPYHVAWVRGFFARFPGRRRRDLGRTEIETFLTEVSRQAGVSNWRLSQARAALEIYYEQFRGIALAPRPDGTDTPSDSPRETSAQGLPAASVRPIEKHPVDRTSSSGDVLPLQLQEPRTDYPKTKASVNVVAREYRPSPPVRREIPVTTIGEIGIGRWGHATSCLSPVRRSLDEAGTKEDQLRNTRKARKERDWRTPFFFRVVSRIS